MVLKIWNLRMIYHADGGEFDGDAPFAFDGVGVEKAVGAVARIKAMSEFQKAVGESSLAMIYVRDDGKVPDGDSHNLLLGLGDGTDGFLGLT